MKKSIFPPGICLTLLFVLISKFVFALDLTVPKKVTDIRKKVESLPSCIDIKYTEEVEERISFLLGKNKGTTEMMLGRSALFFPLIEGVFEEMNIPQELKYIAVIESGLNPEAKSRSNAVGLWQFMKGTADHIGLKITKAVDERRDPIKSTYAAADYLLALYNIYNDWTLALAAYNCGPGNVNKAISKAGGSHDYWMIQRYLPNETQKYVPKVIAMQYMMSYYFDHDLWPAPVDQALKVVTSIKIYDKIELIEVARDYNLDFDLLKKLNPTYLKNFIPESDGHYYLTLPEEVAYEFVNRSGKHEDLLHVNALGKSKRNMDPTPIDIAAMIEVEDPMAEYRRPTVEEPEGLEGSGEQKLITYHEIELSASTFKTIKLKRGQTLVEVAVEFEMTLDDLMAVNDIGMDNPPKFGDLIRVTD